MRHNAVALLLLLALALSFGTARAAGPATVATFDPAKGEFPEGLAIDAEGNLFVGMAGSGVIKRVTPAGQVTNFATVPGVGQGFLTGLAFDGSGNIFAGLASFNENAGVWFISRDGGTPRRVFPMPPESLPNDIVFDRAGNIFVSDTSQGTIWTVGSDGKPTRWLEHPLLRGANPSLTPPGFPLGINGLRFDPSGRSLFAAVTDFSRLVRIPVNTDGSAGTPQVVTEASALRGADGIAVASDGTVYVAAGVQFVANPVNQIVAVRPDGSVSILATGEPLRWPASLALSRDGRTLYLTNFDFGRAAGLLTGAPAPALLALDLTQAPAPAAPAAPRTGNAGLASSATDGSYAMGGLIAAAALVGAAAAATRRKRQVRQDR